MSQILELQGRLSFEHIFKASVGQSGGDPKFSASLLFEKGSAVDSKVNAAIERVASDRWGDKAPRSSRACVPRIASASTTATSRATTATRA